MTEKRVIKVSAIMKFFKGEAKLISKGELAMESGQVKSMVFDASVRVLKGGVAGMLDKEYQVELFFNEEFGIEKGQCSCPRKKLLCHHMAALVIFAQEHMTNKECFYKVKKFTGQEKVQTAEEMFPSKPYKAINRTLTSEEIKAFKEKISKNGPVGFSWLLADRV